MCMGARARTRARVITVGGDRYPRTHCDDCGVWLNNRNTKGNLRNAITCGKCYLAWKQRQREGKKNDA